MPPLRVKPAPEKSPGWHCRPGEGEGPERGWDCSLVGPDPRGMAREVREGEEASDWADASTITRGDEERFRRMASLLPADPWKNACAGKRQTGPMREFLLTPEEQQAREKAPLEIRSNYFEMLENEVANFSGSAEMVQADRKLWGDFVTRDTVTNTVNAHGNVLYQEKGYALSSDTGFLDTDTSRGVFRNTQFILSTIPARGTSRLTHLDSATLSRYQKFTYTACPPGNTDWLLHASHVKLNKETGVGTARNAWLEFHDVPLLWAPYFRFPIDDRRQTGFLTPSLAATKVGGVDLQVPYYFNLAPNYDWTVTPRYLTRRGFLLRNEFRYLTEMTRGQLLADIMPHDEQTKTTRGQLGFLNNTRFSENLIAHVDANYVSDNRYLYQLGSALSLVNWANIPSQAYLRYTGSNYLFQTTANYYQTIDPLIPPQAKPYFNLPQFLFAYNHALLDTGVLFDGQVQLDNFETTGTQKTTGQRLKLRPRLYYPFQVAGGFITPSVSLLHNQYWLQNPEYWGQATQTATRAQEQFTVPILSLDSGAYFDRDFQWGETPMLQTLEPRLFYLYIPRAKQDNIPVFDSSQYDFTYYQLFRENRFTGSDRVGDANQLSLAMTTRLIDQASGRERLRASLGNALYFQDRQVTLIGPPLPSQLQSTSNLISEIYANLTDDWSLHIGGQYSPERSQIDRGLVSLQYNNRQNQLLNVAYRYRRDQYTLTCVKNATSLSLVTTGCLDLADVSFRLPIAEGWHAIGRWQYSILDNATLESFAGIERETCCWRFTLLARRYINNANKPVDGQYQYNNGVFVQLELKGLTRLGDQVDRFLERSVSGYRFFPTH
ncbi:LPS-assembly protein LptD [Candidatus Methylocalor cossyra]|uniref:LPS-assembly protein LptD n=1 Tax=Candidatus Methylocalor cossyra TaxID=3108543 RepID=A0ABP1C8S2_9GAMM